MSTRVISLLAGAALALPLPAWADCAARIAAVEGHPAIGQAGSAADGKEPGGARSPTSPSGSVQVDGGATTHPEGGPATPSESWFTDSEHEDRAAVLAHLDSAREAQGAGDERACLAAVEQAEAALEGQ